MHLGSLFEAQQLDRQSSCGKDTDCTQLIFVLLQQRAEESARTPRTGRSPLALSLFFCLSLQPWAKVARVAVGTRGSSLRSGFRSSSSGWRAGQRKAPRPLASRKPTTCTHELAAVTPRFKSICSIPQPKHSKQVICFRHLQVCCVASSTSCLASEPLQCLKLPLHGKF